MPWMMPSLPLMRSAPLQPEVLQLQPLLPPQTWFALPPPSEVPQPVPPQPGAPQLLLQTRQRSSPPPP